MYMKIGIMGGTFDPIHNGHLMLAEYAYHQYSLDEIWFMPNGNPPHKTNETIETQTKNRVEMVKRAIADTSYFSLQLYEVENAGIHYSYKTIECFKNKYPEDEFYFIIGADSLFSIERWVHPELLMKDCVILAAFRDDIDTVEEMNVQIEYLNQKYSADIRLLNTPNVNISSSQIRENIKEQQSIKEFVPEAVFAYITEKGLYRDEIL